MQTAPRGRGRPKLRPDAEIRGHILECAFQRMIRHGYTATRMDDIANDCRLSKRTLYRLFPGKIELFAAMVEMHRHLMVAIPEEPISAPLEEALARIFRIDLDPQEDHRRIAFLELAVREARHNVEIGEIMRRQSGDKSREELALWLSECRERDLVRIADPDLAASMLINLVFGAEPLKAGHSPELPGAQDRKLYLRNCIHYFVNGMG